MLLGRSTAPTGAAPVTVDVSSAVDRLGAGGVAAIALAGVSLLVPLVLGLWQRRHGHSPDNDSPRRSGWAEVGGIIACVVAALGIGYLAAVLYAVAASRLDAGDGAVLPGFGLAGLVTVVWAVWLSRRLRVRTSVAWPAATVLAIALAWTLAS